MTSPSRRSDLMRVELPLAVLGATLIGMAFVFAHTGIPRWLPPAAGARAGIPTPLSGMTRSFVALASGDPAAAFRWHPLGPVVFVACVAAVAAGTVSWTRGRRFSTLAGILGRRWVWWSVAGALVAAWIRQLVWFGTL